MRKFLLFLLFIFATGCSFPYKAVGVYTDYNEVLKGTIKNGFIKGKFNLELEGQVTKTECRGRMSISRDTIEFDYDGHRGEGNLVCSDGRKIKIEWYRVGHYEAYGKGVDQDNKEILFTFWPSDEKTAELVETAMKKGESKQPLPRYARDDRMMPKLGQGTGFYVTDDGYLITNYHVVKGARQFFIHSPKNSTLNQAKLIYTDKTNDIALLKVEVQSSPLPLTSSSGVRKGDRVLALGYPAADFLGTEMKATFGEINSISGEGSDFGMFQVSAQIQPGNSGGPLVDKDGNVIGINSASYEKLPNGDTVLQNVNYAVKSDYIFPLLSTQKAVNLPPKASAGRSMEELVKDYEDSVVLIKVK